jgi:hypothetical protein
MTGGTFTRIVGGRFKPLANLPRRVLCKACGHSVGKLRKGRLMLRAANRCVVVRDDGVAEVTCESCGARAELPLSLTSHSETP